MGQGQYCPIFIQHLHGQRARGIDIGAKGGTGRCERRGNQHPFLLSGVEGDETIAPQHMREMLTQSSFESFRVSTLDLMSRLEELIDALQAVEENHLPMATIEPVLEPRARAPLPPALAAGGQPCAVAEVEDRHGWLTFV